jgi:polysaccharide export outer membrane protein
MDTLRPVVVNVTGEVQRPGPIQLRSVTSASGSNTSQPSLEGAPRISSALVEAGGVTTHANIRQIEVRRTLPDGESRIVTVDLWDAVWSANAPEDLILQDGDSIYVHRLPEGEDFDRRLLARSSLAPQTIRVRVVGEVTRPGEVQVSPDGSISSAVAIAGGPTQDARLSRVELIRLNQDGTISNQRLDLSDLNDSIQVQEGDVVIVPERGDSSFFRVLGRALGPIGSLLGIFDRITNLGF